MRSLLLSPLAARDLEEIGDFLSDRNPLAAIEVVERFWKVSRSLSENPKSARRGQTSLRAFGTFRCPHT
jgi:plasmid stabilization system protein ParE